jgi:hypothetical protein
MSPPSKVPVGFVGLPGGESTFDGLSASRAECARVQWNLEEAIVWFNLTLLDAEKLVNASYR